jgi:hypothetical protein
MAYIVEYNTVSTVGLESSPVAAALGSRGQGMSTTLSPARIRC